MERWDAYREDGSPAGCELVRGESIPEGLFHLVCEIVVRHGDGSYLLMQRDFRKAGYPGKWEASAGGAVLKGETALQGAQRELLEETGIESDSFTPLYRVCSAVTHTIYCGFLCTTQWNKTAIVLQEGETIAYQWISEEALLAFLSTQDTLALRKNRLDGFAESLHKKE